MTHRILIALIALIVLLVAPLAAAQQQQPQQQPQQQTAPERHPTTGLVFPSRIGPGVRDAAHDYSKTHNRPELGYSWHYTARGLYRASVYVYALGLTSIPSGAASPDVIAQLEQSVAESLEGAKRRNEELKVTRAAHECSFADVVFRCATLSFQRTSKDPQLETWLMVTGYRDQFVKMRIDWLPGAKGDTAARNWVAATATQMR